VKTEIEVQRRYELKRFENQMLYSLNSFPNKYKSEYCNRSIGKTNVLNAKLIIRSSFQYFRPTLYGKSVPYNPEVDSKSLSQSLRLIDLVIR